MLSACMSVPHVYIYMVPIEDKKGVMSPATGVIGDSQLPCGQWN